MDLGILVILVSNLLGATTVLMVLYFLEQLDQGVATIDWILKLLSPNNESSHFRFSSSDHKSLCLCSDDEKLRFYHKKRHFYFEAMWIKDENCHSVVKIA